MGGPTVPVSLKRNVFIVGRIPHETTVGKKENECR